MTTKECAGFDSDLEHLVSEAEFAKIIGRSLVTVQRDRYKRRGCPFVRLGRLVRYRPADIRSYIESNRRAKSPDEFAHLSKPMQEERGSALN
jgi:hypothetical protein